LGGNSESAAKLYHVQEFLGATYLFLLYAYYIDILILVLPDFELVAVVEQVIELAAVDLIEAHHCV